MVGTTDMRRPSRLLPSDASCISLTVRIMRMSLMERVGVVGKSARPDLSYIVLYAFFYLFLNIYVHLRKLGPETAEPEKVVSDENLAVAIGSRPYTYGRNREHTGDLSGCLPGHTFEDHGKSACFLHC